MKERNELASELIKKYSHDIISKFLKEESFSDSAHALSVITNICGFIVGNCCLTFLEKEQYEEFFKILEELCLKYKTQLQERNRE